MIQTLRNRHKGQTIAILGSAPSVELYKSMEDVAIAVNGASQLEQKIDYFITGHQRAHERSWFKTREGIIKIINSMAAAYSEELYPDNNQREKIIREYEESIKQNPQTDFSGFKYNEKFRGLPTPAKPHVFFYYGTSDGDMSKKIKKDQTELYAGGTSACLGVQVANIMGVKEIHLYGCSFDNASKDAYNGSNYFYKPKEGEKGHTDEAQREFMDKVIQTIMSTGVPIYSHGKTNLKNAIKLDY